jgi:uncharacterized protein (DUF2249 family)
MNPTRSLDVRPVEPKHRFETIMGAYDSVPAGGTLHLTVDHDPRCMYYTLQHTHGDETFRFDYLESGPEVWRVAVLKLTDGPTADGT